VVEKKVMKSWTWERVCIAVEMNLPNWTINQKEPESVKCTMKIKVLCPRSHENEKNVSGIERKSGLGCTECNKENQAQKTYSRFVEALKNEGWSMHSSLEELLGNGKKYAQTPLKVVCPNGESHMTGWNGFSQGSRCSCLLCRPYKASKGVKKNKLKGIVEARERFREIGLELLSGEWRGTQKKINGKNVHQKYEVRCLVCGYTRHAFAGVILRKEKPCPVCSGHKGSLETFTMWTNEKRPEFEVPQNQIYQGCMRNIKILCMKHEVIFELRPNDFKNGVNSCSLCIFEQQSKTTKKLHTQYNIDGNNHPYWNGLRPLYAYLREQLGEWKQDSMKVHGYKCFVTGGRIGAVHHTTSFKDIVSETMKRVGLPIHETIDKYSSEERELIRSTCLKLHDFYGLGIPLSTEIHEEFHSMYRNRSNTLEQFIEFLRIKGHDELAIKVINSEMKKD